MDFHQRIGHRCFRYRASQDDLEIGDRASVLRYRAYRVFDALAQQKIVYQLRTDVYNKTATIELSLL